MEHVLSRTLGVVASGHKETSRAARILLEEGGNAFDAALGAMCAAWLPIRKIQPGYRLMHQLLVAQSRYEPSPVNLP